MPFISIITPVYKVEKYLERCIKSILEQDFRDFELILIDDGSPDKCPEICDYFAEIDNRVHVFHKSNGGVSSARNHGLQYATGSYIWFVDSDDRIGKNALGFLYEIIQRNSADLYVLNSKITDKFCGKIEELFEKYYFRYHLGFEAWNKIYKKEIIKQYNILFDEEEKIGEDLLFNISYYTHIQNGILHINNEIYFYENRIGSAMSTNYYHRIYQQLRLFEKIEKKLLGIVTDEVLVYLFLMHLISGIVQSGKGRFSAESFSKIDFKRYRNWIIQIPKIKHKFFLNENASVFGKVRVNLFVFFMNVRKYRLAGKVMGLKWRKKYINNVRW